jgi:hypothetical protein
MPSLLERIDLNFKTAEKELAEFDAFLHQNAHFSERQVVTELKRRVHLSCLIGHLSAGVPRADVYKFEFQILGAFKADLVVGNMKTKRFVFVEFESGQVNSLFGPRKTNQMRDWSREIGHGFGQLVDWGWALDDAAISKIFENAIGCEDIAPQFLLVCGRDQTMDTVENGRFSWRSRKVTLSGRQATTLTYDGLLLFFRSTIEAVKTIAENI